MCQALLHLGNIKRKLPLGSDLEELGRSAGQIVKQLHPSEVILQWRCVTHYPISRVLCLSSIACHIVTVDPKGGDFKSNL